MSKREADRMSDLSFRMMSATFSLIDLFYPRIDQRVLNFGLQPGMTVVDYGCGPGRYTLRFSRLVGPGGKVYAVDIHGLAVETVKSKIEKYHLANVTAVLAQGYDSGLPEHIADAVCAIDMFFGVKEPATFLGELRRIIKPEGTLIIDDGHQPRKTTREKILASGYWEIREETPDHLKCRLK